MRALALGDEGAWLEESTADGSIVAQLAAQSEGLREALGDFRAAAAELPGEVLAQSSVVAAAQVTQDVGEDARCGLYLVTPSRWRRSARQSSPPLSPGVIAGACVGGALLLAGVGALVASRRRSELGHEHALLGVSSHPGDQVLYTDNGALLGNGKSATTPRRRCL